MKNIVKYTGNIVTLLAIILIFKRILDMRMDFSFLKGFKSFFILIILTIISGFCIYLSAVPWAQTIYITTKKRISYIQIANVACKANLMKYVPGNVFQYIGRNELAERENLRHRDVIAATVIDIIISVLGMSFAALALYSKSLRIIMNQYNMSLYSMQVTIIILIVIVLLIGIYIKKNHKQPYKHLTKYNALRILVAVIYYVVWGVVYGMLYYITLKFVLQYDVPTNEVTTVIGAFLGAWVLGYIMPGVPGGIGIRETLVMLLLASLIDQDTVLLAALVFRFINIVGDVFAYVFSVFMTKLKSDQYPHEIL